MRDIDLIVTNEEPYGFSADSPQLPGFVFGRPTMTEFNTDLPPILHAVAKDYFPGELDFSVTHHRQELLNTPEGVSAALRVALAPPTALDARTAVLRRLQAVLTQTDPETTAVRLDILDGLRPNATGDITFVCVVPADRFSDVVRSLDDRSDSLNLMAAVAEQGLWSLQLATREEDTTGVGWTPLEDFAFPADTTISDLMMIADLNRSKVLV